MRKRTVVVLSVALILLVCLSVFLSATITGKASWKIFGSKGGGGAAVKTQCSDGIDNDGDGYCDFSWRKVRCIDGSIPGDADCSSRDDNEERGTDCSVTGNCLCGEQGGFICSGDEYCPGNGLTAADSDSCCSQQCLPAVCTTCNSCGSGLFNLCDRAECYSCTGGNCYFLDHLLVDTCNSCSSATCSSYGSDQVTCYDDPCGIGSCSWRIDSCMEVSNVSFLARTFSSLDVSPGELVNVSLTFIVGNNNPSYYLVEETVPAGWVVVDDGGSVSNEENVLRWAVVEGTGSGDVVDARYGYTVRAPASSGDYFFDGSYAFEGVGDVKDILGNSIVSVH